MASEHRTNTRTRTATALTTGLLTALITITLALTAVFAPNTSTRQAATRTLDLLLRLVPWYTPRR
ncbi:hypothetical protein [Streptomyces misionensis]|uniref:hypothetical protein n=1 Tax=Streptomyces misionensis TaxID=67331 RepID=UPI0036F640AD